VVPRNGVEHAAHWSAVSASDSLSDRELVERARQDPESFAVLYRRYLPRIRAFVIRRCGNRQLADDLTAAVFERAWINIDRLEITDQGLGPWLYRVAGNEVASAFRKSGRGLRAQHRLEHLAPEEPSDPVNDILLRADIAAVRSALTTLPERHQLVISLRYLAGLTPQETAEVMGIGPPAVAAVLHRALKALDRALRAQGFVAPTEPDHSGADGPTISAPPVTALDQSDPTDRR